MKSRAVWKLQAVFFCDDYFARKQAIWQLNLTTRSFEFILLSVIQYSNEGCACLSATGYSFLWYCLDLELTFEKLFLDKSEKAIYEGSWLLKGVNDLFFHFISVPGWKDHFSVFWYYFFIANQGKRKICYFGFHFLFPKVGRERGGNYQVRSETDCSSEISKSPLKCA